jgi:hypothetical protein
MNESKILGPEISYVDFLDYATEEAVNNEKSKYNPIRPSGSGKCSRELAYELMEFYGLATYEKEPQTAELTRIFAYGHHTETMLVEQFEKYAGKTFQSKYKQQVLHFYNLEAKNHPELSQTVEGSLDTCFYSPTTRGVIDYKSKKDKFSGFFKTNWDESTRKLSEMRTVQVMSEKSFWVEDLPAFLKELNDPFFASNFLQLNGYACTEFLRSRGVDHGAIIQYNKNDSRLREVRFKPSLELFEQVKRKFQSALQAVDERNLDVAPRDFMLGGIKCAFCKFAKDCWKGSGEDSRQAYFDTFPRKQWPDETRKMGETGEQLEVLFGEYLQVRDAEKERKSIEQEILTLLAANQIHKIKTADGEVYEAKQLKNEVSLRRSKV